ncbi:hypothetical protein HYW83_06205 [Candidatus Peregrinibacteria bacterium]|nr:hypothetical protein [Candidatus Peregrinibacteria bacterium]
MIQKFNFIIGETRFIFKTETPEKDRQGSGGQNSDADRDALLKLESIEAVGLLTPDMQKELDALRAKGAQQAKTGTRAMDRAATAGKTPPVDFTQEPEAAKLWRMPLRPLPETAPTEMRILTKGIIEINGKKTTRDNVIIYADALIQDADVTWTQVRDALEEQFGIPLPHDLEHYGTNGGEPTAEQVADLIIKIAAGKAPGMDQIAYYKNK